MAEIKGLLDDNGVLFECQKNLPLEYWNKLLESLAELENNECHRKKEFPKSRLHKVTGAKGVYRIDIDKISGWRIHVIYGDDQRMHLCEVLEPKQHDAPIKNIKSKKNKYK